MEICKHLTPIPNLIIFLGWVLELPASLGGDPRTNSSVFYTLLITEAFALVWIVGITISIYIAEQSDRDENAEQLIVLAINAFAHAIGLGSESFATKAIWFLSLISAGYVMQLVAVSIIMYWASHRFQLPEWLTRIEFYRLDLIEGCCSLYIPAFSVATATIGLVVVYLYEHLIVQYSNYVFTVEYVLCLATLICWGYAATLEGRQEQDYGPYIFPVFTFEGREQRLVDQNLACMLFYVGAMFVFFNVVYISMVLVSICKSEDGGGWRCRGMSGVSEVERLVGERKKEIERNTQRQLCIYIESTILNSPSYS